ncbi:MAG: PEP-CTERM sorting domain-containing protein [Lacipirellulaceae bacterium]
MNIRHLLTLTACGAMLALSASATFAQTVELEVNRVTGEIRLVANGGDVEIDSYQISSTMDALSLAEWNSFEDQFNPGQLDNTSWFESGSAPNPLSDSNLSELKTLGTSTITAAGVSIGNAWDEAARLSADFLVDVEEGLAFTYGTPSTGGGTINAGAITFTPDNKEHNNLVLNIDSSGNASIENESNTAVNLTGYSIFSDTAASLDVSFAGIAEAGWEDANPSDTALSQTNQTGSRLLNPGDEVSIGNITLIGLNAGNLDFDYTITQTDINPRTGEPLNLATINGEVEDVIGGGAFDGAEFLRLQRENPAGIPNWETNYGSGASTASVGAVPEPSAIALCLLGMIGLGATRRNK